MANFFYLLLETNSPMEFTQASHKTTTVFKPMVIESQIIISAVQPSQEIKGVGLALGHTKGKKEGK